jgi:hypothetical protein
MLALPLRPGAGRAGHQAQAGLDEGEADPAAEVRPTCRAVGWGGPRLGALSGPPAVGDLGPDLAGAVAGQVGDGLGVHDAFPIVSAVAGGVPGRMLADD